MALVVCSLVLNPLMSSVTFLYPLKTSEKRRFSDVFRGYQNETLDINGLRKDIVLFIFFSIVFFESIQILKSIPRYRVHHISVYLKTLSCFTCFLSRGSYYITFSFHQIAKNLSYSSKNFIIFKIIFT